MGIQNTFKTGRAGSDRMHYNSYVDTQQVSNYKDADKQEFTHHILSPTQNPAIDGLFERFKYPCNA